MARRESTIGLREIAQEANVSSATVSRALHAPDNKEIPERTRVRIREIADRLGYRPNLMARSLRSQKSGVIGFFHAFPQLLASDAFIGSLITGLQEGCADGEKDLLLYRTHRNVDDETVYRQCTDGRVDGLILYTGRELPLVARLREHPALPVVAIADQLDRIPSVVADDAGSSAQMARFLADKGHRNVLYRASSKPLVSADRRRTAFLAEAETLGLTVTTQWDIDPFFDFPTPAPTVVVCWEDGHAFQWLRECERRGVRVPGELAIVGFDGLVAPTGATVLTTMRAPWQNVARTAVRLLTDKIAGNAVAMETVLPVEFIEGNTA